MKRKEGKLTKQTAVRATAQNYLLARRVPQRFQETFPFWSLTPQSVELVTQNLLELLWQDTIACSFESYSSLESLSGKPLVMAEKTLVICQGP